MYSTAEEVIQACQEQDLTIYELALQLEMEETNRSQKEIEDHLIEAYQVMKNSTKKGQEEELTSISGLLKGNAKALKEHAPKAQLVNPELLIGMARAISVSEVNASMGQIVASPTAGAAGILPASLVTWQEKSACEDKEIIKGLLTASQVGAIIMSQAHVSGAEGGCQAECGSASAMSAAALVELMGGSVEQAFKAASFALISVMGLVCDPIHGRVEFPCYLRNASGLMNAFISAELAMADLQVFSTFDQSVRAMKEVGNSMPASLRETGLGGIAKYCRLPQEVRH